MKIATTLVHGVPSKKELEEKLGAAPAFTLAFASTKQPLAEVLAACPGEVVMGCSTAGEFTEGGDAKGATSLFSVSGDVKAFAGFATGLKQDAEAAVKKASASLPSTVEGYPHRTAIVLLDALSGVSEETTLLVASYLGGDARLAGGAAGDDLQFKAPLVGVSSGSGKEAASDALALAVLFTKKPLGVGVCHGHRGLSKPLKITKASGATVFTVDGRPAWDVWKEETRAAAQKRGIDVDKIPAGDLGAFLLQFEAGLDDGSGTPKIRAPLSKGEDGSLSFACGIPEGAVVRITEGEANPQVESARIAARRARAQLGGGAVAGAVVFDCICRNLILGDRFKEAVKGMHEELGGAPLAGFESYGEVALDAADMSGFHNTTTVVLAFGA